MRSLHVKVDEVEKIIGSMLEVECAFGVSCITKGILV